MFLQRFLVKQHVMVKKGAMHGKTCYSRTKFCGKNASYKVAQKCCFCTAGKPHFLSFLGQNSTSFCCWKGCWYFLLFLYYTENKRKYHACAKFVKVDNSGVLEFTKKINYLFEKVFFGKLSNSLFNNVFGAGFTLKASPSCSCYWRLIPYHFHTCCNCIKKGCALQMFSKKGLTEARNEGKNI